MTGTLPVSEVFSPTLQGEGPAAGRAASFVRFMGCNLSCSWCDTPYTWDASRYDLNKQLTWMTPQTILDLVLAHPPRVVVLTGGEPLLQQDRPPFEALVHGLVDAGREIHVETNGTIIPGALLLSYAETICVSPKLATAGLHRGHQDPTMRAEYRDLAARPNLHLKVVCQDRWDVGTAVALAKRFQWPLERVWVMPEGTHIDVLNSRWPVIADEATALGINASHRLHVLAWGDERGH